MPRSSAEVRKVFNHDIKEVEDVGQQEQQDDKRVDEKGDEVNALHTLLGFALCTSCQQFNCCRGTYLFNF